MAKWPNAELLQELLSWGTLHHGPLHSETYLDTSWCQDGGVWRCSISLIVIANCSDCQNIWKQWQIMTNHRLKRGKDPQHGILRFFYSSPLFKCSSTTRLKTQSWGPHVDPPKRTCHLGKRWWDDRDTHGCKFPKKNWGWKIIYFCKGHPIIPPKITCERGGIWKINKSWTLLQAQRSKSLSIPYCEKMRNEMICLMNLWSLETFVHSTTGDLNKSKKPSNSPTRANP